MNIEYLIFVTFFCSVISTIIENVLAIFFVEWFYFFGIKKKIISKDVSNIFKMKFFLNSKNKTKIENGYMKISKKKNAIFFREFFFGGESIGNIPTLFFIGYFIVIHNNERNTVELFLRILLGPILLAFSITFFCLYQLILTKFSLIYLIGLVIFLRIYLSKFFKGYSFIENFFILIENKLAYKSEE